MSSAADRVRINKILDKFCWNKMTYEPTGMEGLDGKLFNDKDMFIGIVKIFSSPSNFGNNPIVEISKGDVDFIYELGLLTDKKPAVVCKFRNKIAYLRLDHVNYKFSESKRGLVYKIPIGELKVL